MELGVLRRQVRRSVYVFCGVTMLNCMLLIPAGLSWFFVPERTFWAEDSSARLFQLTPLDERTALRWQQQLTGLNEDQGAAVQ